MKNGILYDILAREVKHPRPCEPALEWLRGQPRHDDVLSLPDTPGFNLSDLVWLLTRLGMMGPYVEERMREASQSVEGHLAEKVPQLKGIAQGSLWEQRSRLHAALFVYCLDDNEKSVLHTTWRAASAAVYVAESGPTAPSTASKYIMRRLNGPNLEDWAIAQIPALIQALESGQDDKAIGL